MVVAEYGSSDSTFGSDLDKTHLPLDSARHAPGYVYGSPDVLRLEKGLVFQKDWLCVARVEEIEKPGDYLTLRVLDEPVLLTHDNEGTLNALANICRHRGVEVAQGAGSAKEFSCPYHGWLYDLSGKLVGAPYMKSVKGFDLPNCRLKQLRSEIWSGWIFITFNPDALPLQDFIAEFKNDFDFLKQEECRLADKLVVDVDCNWKLVVENLLDIYHVSVLHKKTFGRFVTPETYQATLRSNGGLIAYYKAAPSTSDGKSLFGNMPWFADKPESFACQGYLRPNVIVFGRCDYVRVFVMWPLGVGKCRVIAYTLLPGDRLSRPDFSQNIAKYRDALRAILSEDETMIDSLQNVMSSEQFEPGPMSQLEVSIHHVLNNHLDRLFGE